MLGRRRAHPTLPPHCPRRAHEVRSRIPSIPYGNVFLQCTRIPHSVDGSKSEGHAVSEKRLLTVDREEDWDVGSMATADGQCPIVQKSSKLLVEVAVTEIILGSEMSSRLESWVRLASGVWVRIYPSIHEVVDAGW